MDEFEINGLRIRYNVGSNRYFLVDMNYASSIGALSLEEGPGWVLHVWTSFLDWGQLQTVADLVSALNEELSDA